MEDRGPNAQQTQDFAQAEAARAAQELGVPNDTPNEPVVETAAPEPVQPIEPETPTAPQEAPVAPEPGSVVQPETAPAEVPEEEDEDFLPQYNPYQYQQQPAPQQAPPQYPQQVAPQQPPQLPSLDPTQFTDQYGNVDMARFGQAMQQRDQALVGMIANAVTQDAQTSNQRVLAEAAQISTQRVMEARAEERAWDRTFEKYPQVKANKDLRDQVQKMRLGEVASTGKNVSPVKVADRLFKVIASAREEGVKSATETVRIQSSAHLETANNTASEKGLKAQQDWSKIDSRDRRESDTARTALLKQMLTDGQI